MVDYNRPEAGYALGGDRPSPEPYTYGKNGVVHAACDACGWHSFGLPKIKRRVVARWARAHVCAGGSS